MENKYKCHIVHDNLWFYIFCINLSDYNLAWLNRNGTFGSYNSKTYFNSYRWAVATFKKAMPNQKLLNKEAYSRIKQ